MATPRPMTLHRMSALRLLRLYPGMRIVGHRLWPSSTRWRETRLLTPTVSNSGTYHPTEELPEEESFQDLPEEVYLSQDSCNDLARKLDILSEKSREILLLRVIHGYSAEETAEIVGSKPTAVRVAQHRAVMKLKKHGIIQQ